MPRAAFKFTTKWDGLDKLIVRYKQGLRSIDELTAKTYQRFGREATAIFRDSAPKRTGKMARSIRATTSGGVLSIRIGAKSQTGYPYPAVTRFGHRKDLIEPRTDRNVLRLQLPGGMVLYRNRVRGFKPAGDWAEQARADLRSALRREMVTLGRDAVRRFA